MVDIGLGGLRVYSDEPLKLGERLDIELFLPDDTSLHCLVRVAWLTALSDGPARYDVGLQILDIGSNSLMHLGKVLDFDAF